MLKGCFSKEYIGKRITQIRNDSCLDAKAFAQRVNVTTRTLSMWEQGNTVPSLENMVSICNIFHVKLDSFVLYK